MKIKLKGRYTTQEVWLNGKLLDLKKSLAVSNKSPSGFAWGYGGSGPAQLALAILLEVLPKAEAISKYQKFKEEVVANLPQTDFEVEIEI